MPIIRGGIPYFIWLYLIRENGLVCMIFWNIFDKFKTWVCIFVREAKIVHHSVNFLEIHREIKLNIMTVPKYRNEGLLVSIFWCICKEIYQKIRDFGLSNQTDFLKIYQNAKRKSRFPYNGHCPTEAQLSQLAWNGVNFFATINFAS